jgi:integrase
MGAVDGKRKRSAKYTRTQNEAVRLLAEMRRRRDDGLPPQDASMLLHAWLTWWLSHVVQRSALADSTQTSYEAEVRLHISPALGRLPLSKVTTLKITEWTSAMAAEAAAHPKARPSANTRRIRYAVLHRALNDAVRHGLLARNPAAAVPGPQVERDDEKVRSLTLDEVKRLLSAAEHHRLRALWYLLVLVGLRKGEALGLRWSDIDMPTAQLHVYRSLGRAKGKGLVFHDVKTKRSRRSVQIPLVVLTALQRHWAEQAAESIGAGGWRGSTDLVFVAKSGQPIEPSNLNRQFATLCKQAGLEPLRVHDLRHTAATMMRVYGAAELFDVSRVLGHSSIRVTADMYGHEVPEVQQQIAARLDEAFTPPDA